MTRAKHRPPSPLVIAYTAHRRHVIDALLVAALALPVAAVYAAAVDVAPRVHASTAAAPTAVEKTREPTGHGGPIGPLALPSPAAGLPVWTEEKGPVVVDGQPLPAPAAVTPAPNVQMSEPNGHAPAPEEPSSPAPVVAAAEPAPQPPTGLLALVNADRAAAGCGPVRIADDLNSQSQTQSNAQAADDQMKHSAAGPEGYDTWGENVAYGQATEAEVHSDWMGSEHHRDNILNCTFTLIGWASADSATGVRYWTESFAA